MSKTSRDPRSGPRVLACSVLALFAAGCSEPTFAALTGDAGASCGPSCSAEVEAGTSQLDAAVGEAGASFDAGRASDTSTPPELTVHDAQLEGAEGGMTGPLSAGAPLLGHYAVIARFRGQDVAPELGWLSEEIVALAEITREATGERLRMSWRVCEHRHSIVSPLLSREILGRVLHPEALPPRVFELSLSGGTFRTASAPQLAGYEPLSASACPAGSKQRKPDRPWLPTGECTCPSTELPPDRSDDCRVIDSDADRHPGLTVDYRGGTVNQSYVRMKDQSQIVDGTIDATTREHRASYAWNSDSHQFACATGSCTRRNLQICPAKLNPVHFVPLSERPMLEPWSCEHVMREVDERGLFRLEPPTAPGPEC